MKKFLEMALVVEKTTVEEQRLVRVHVRKALLRDWCLCLQLLRDELVEAFVFHQNKSSEKIKFQVDATYRSHVNDDQADVEVSLAVGDLDFIRHFFLRYYRDQIADVDHIDIETENGGYITFSVEDSRPPLSQEEARRHLGIK